MDLSVNNIEKSFVGKQVLSDVAFHAHGGKAFGLLGRNGAGKTTTIRIIMKVFPADRGEVLFDGRPFGYSTEKLGYLPEERGLYPKKKIIQQLSYLAELKGLGRSEAIRSVDYWLDRLGMAEYRNRRLDTLSKGNQQKIQLITTLAHDPDIVILDEPFSGLDPVNAMLLKDVVKEQIGQGKIVIFSSHQMNYIEEFCDDIAILHHGRIALQGSLGAIKRAYARDRLVVRSEQGEAIKEAFGDACTAREDKSLLIHLGSAGDKREGMRHIVENFDVDEVKVFEPSLNDIFVEYAGDGAQEVDHEAV